MESVTVQVDDRLVRMARSPLYWIVAALQGVAATFAPLFLYWSGKGGYFAGMESLVALVCFGVILLVSLFHFQFSGVLLRELRKPRDAADAASPV